MSGVSKAVFGVVGIDQSPTTHPIENTFSNDVGRSQGVLLEKGLAGRPA